MMGLFLTVSLIQSSERTLPGHLHLFIYLFIAGTQTLLGKLGYL